MLNQIDSSFGDIFLRPVFTGSAGMGIAERIHLPFIQEIIAVSTNVNKQYQGEHSLIDIGGEDSKLAVHSES